jgi:CubicO group peptidase (beta-lactamase class C family)
MVKGVYLVACDDDILYFHANDEFEVDGKTKINPYTTYEIASTTKTFTATAVLQLIERGKLSLDDTIDKFFPDFENGKKITIYHLLHMQSGLYDHINDCDKFFKNDDKEFLLGILFDKVSDEEFIEALNKSDLQFEPGTMFNYCNTSYHVLALIIEQVSGMRYDEYIQKNIFDVCGMEHSSSMKIGDVTSTTNAEGTRAKLTDHGYSVSPVTDRGDGDIHTCAADLLAFDRALKNGKLINEDSLAEMFNMDKSYGCGMMQFSPKLFHHSGNNPGFKSVNEFLDSDFGNVYIIKFTHF